MKLLALNSCAVQKAWGLMLALSPGNSLKGRSIRLLSGEWHSWCKAKSVAVEFHDKTTTPSEKS